MGTENANVRTGAKLWKLCAKQLRRKVRAVATSWAEVADAQAGALNRLLLQQARLLAHNAALRQALRVRLVTKEPARNDEFVCGGCGTSWVSPVDEVHLVGCVLEAPVSENEDASGGV